MRVNQQMNCPLTGVTGKKLVCVEGSPLKVVGAACFVFTWYLNNNSLKYIFVADINYAHVRMRIVYTFIIVFIIINDCCV